MSRFRKKDRLIPIISLVFYYGSEPWDGPVDLYDMFQLEGTKEEKEILEKYLPNYKINLVDAERLEDVEKFSDDLQVILTMLRYRDSKEELKHYIDENKKFFQNVYTAVNNRELGPKAYGVVEHFDAGLNANGVLVMAGGPGSDGPVELDWSNLRKEVWTGEEFVGGSLPEDLQEIKAACFIKNYSCLVPAPGNCMSVILPEGICTRTGIRIFLSTGIISSLLWWGIVSLLIIMSLYFMKKMKEDICFWITESYGD